MAGTVISHFLQEFDQEKCLLDVLRAKAQILVVAGVVLVIEIDVEQLACFPGLCYGMQEIDACHMFVSHLRIHSHHLGVVKRLDEGQHGTCCGHVDVPPRLVRFGFQRKLEGETLIDYIIA